MLKTFILPLSEIIQETQDAATLILKQGLVDRISYYAGQYITLKVEIEGETYYRSYSMSSSPRLDRYLAVTIKRVPGGLVSNYILDEFKPGQLVEFLSPAGRFYIQTATKDERHLILMGGGSGITPLMSMLRGVLFHEPKSHVTLLYANRSVSDIIFREQLEELADIFAERFRYIPVLSQGEESEDQSFHVGRLEAIDIPPLLQTGMNDALPPSYWLCGPEGLMKTYRAGLHQMGVEDADIQQERFVADDSMQANQRQVEGPTHVVNILSHGKQYQIRVPAGTTVLEAALAQGIGLPYSCKRGICSTCMADLERGQVEMDNPESLLPFEIEMGKVLLCQCHPLTDDVLIRLGGPAGKWRNMLGLG